MSYALPSSAAALPDEFASCTGTDPGCGVAANAAYIPTATNHDSNGSLVPAVAITATNATTSTTYEVSFTTPTKATDLVFLEVYQNSGAGKGWNTIGVYSGVATGFQNTVPIGVWAIQTLTGWKVGFSNAGRTAGTAYGTAKDDWALINANGWRWRLRKVSR